MITVLFFRLFLLHRFRLKKVDIGREDRNLHFYCCRLSANTQTCQASGRYKGTKRVQLKKYVSIIFIWEQLILYWQTLLNGRGRVQAVSFILWISDLHDKYICKVTPALCEIGSEFVVPHEYISRHAILDLECILCQSDLAHKVIPA